MTVQTRPVNFGTRPATDALARIEELAKTGRLTEDEVSALAQTCDGEGPSRLFTWGPGSDGLPVLMPSRWLAQLIETAGART